MIGTQLAEELVQSVALSHLVKRFNRVSLLMLAAPESGKTTISSAAGCKHVRSIAIISAKSILREDVEHPEIEFMLFNDLSSVRALSHAAMGFLIVTLNHYVQGEKGIVAFAGKDVYEIKRPIGMIGCLPFKIFSDHRTRWNEMGFISRMIPFAYAYNGELVAKIKNVIDNGDHDAHTHPIRKLPSPKKQVTIELSSTLTKELRRLSDARANALGQLGIRLLQNYHCLVRAHALLFGRHAVTRADMDFLRAVDHYVSTSRCEPLV